MVRKIVIFGATGMTGLCVLKYAISKGYDVCAFVRDLSRVPDEYIKKIKIILGSVTWYNAVLEAVKDREEVVVVLGTRNSLEPTTQLSEGMKNIVKAMEECNVKLVSLCLSSFLYRETVPRVFININEEHKRMLAAVENSKLNWVAVCPPRIEEYPGCKYKIQMEAPEPNSKIYKFYLAEFLVECLQNPNNFRNKVTIFNVNNE